MLEEYADILAEEVCEALRIGQLKGYRNGRTWRIPKESVRRFILRKAGLE